MLKKYLQIEIKWIFFLIVFFSCTSNSENIQVTKSTNSGNTLAQTQVNMMGMWFYRESKKDLQINAAREFELLNQNIKINIKFQEEICDYCDDPRMAIEDTVLKMIETDKINWDIIVMTQKNYSDYASVFQNSEWGKEHLANLEEYKWFRESHKTIIFDVPQFRNDMGGIFTGPVIEGRFYSIWYNRKTAEKIGIKVKSYGMTFEEFKEYMIRTNEYNKRSNDKIRPIILSNQSSLLDDVLNSLILSELGDDEISEENKEQSLKALKKSLKAFEELAAYNPNDTSIKISNDIKEPILDGKCLFGVYPSSILNQWQSVNEKEAENMIPVEFPVFEKPGKYYHGTYQSVWAILKNAPHREEAIKFMQFLCSNDIAERWLATTKNPTALNVRLSSSDLGKDEVELFNREIEKKYGNNMRNYNIAEVLFGSQNKNIKIDTRKIIQGLQTADECYNQIVKQIR